MASSRRFPLTNHSAVTPQLRVEGPLGAANALSSWRELYLRSEKLNALDLTAASGSALEKVTLILPQSVTFLDLTPLSTCYNLRDLTIVGGPSHLDVRPLGALKSLSTLFLYESPLRAFDAAALAGCSALSVVWLMDTAITQLDLSSWAGFGSLTSVQCQRSRLQSITVGANAGFRALKYLNLGATPLKQADLSGLSGAQSLREVAIPQHLRGMSCVLIPETIVGKVAWAVLR